MRKKDMKQATLTTLFYAFFVGIIKTVHYLNICLKKKKNIVNSYQLFILFLSS